MAWVQISAYVPGNESESLCQLLTTLGAVSVTLYDAKNQEDILEPKPGENPLWKETRVVGLFDAETNIHRITAILKSKTSVLHAEPLEDKDWVREWMQYFKPLCFGERLWICPSWCEPPDPNALSVLLDPGLAFGTGTHPTTALCLEWLATHIQPGMTVVDYGCGSGILGIVAKRLGAKSVIAVDYDPQALAATLTNAVQNGFTEADIICCLPEQCPNIQADLVIANILAGPLTSLAPRLLELLAPTGTIMLSGLLSSQIESVQAAYPNIQFESPTQQEDWVRLVGINAESHSFLQYTVSLIE